MTADDDNGLPTAAEIAALTARLRGLSVPFADEDTAERAAFLVDKDALLARIPDALRPSETDQTSYQDTADGNHENFAAARRDAGTYQWQTDAADPDRVALYPESIGHGWDRDADEYGPDVADELFDAENPHYEPPEEWYDDRDLDHDGWFSDGYDAAHDDHLAALGQADLTPPPGTVLDDRLAAVPMPAEMLEGIEERRDGPAERDDPADLNARLAELRNRLAASSGEPPGGWRTVSAAAAAQDLTDRGADPGHARAAVADYLRETSDRFGVPADAWGLDQADIDAIAAAHRLPVAAAAVIEHDAAEAERADQLNRWHTDDHAAADTTDVTESAELDDGTGWSR